MRAKRAPSSKSQTKKTSSPKVAEIKTPISHLNKTQLQDLMKFYDSGNYSGTLATGRKDFLTFLSKVHYVGPRNYEHLMNPDVRDEIIRTARRQIANVVDEIPLGYNRVQQL
jgi:hypothetical protein